MSAQTYTAPIALERMRAGNCPECGTPPLGHGNDVRFWVPSNQRCNLLERGATERIEWQQHLDAAERQAAYDEGRWCGECQYGVVMDPPCCSHSQGPVPF